MSKISNRSLIYAEKVKKIIDEKITTFPRVLVEELIKMINQDIDKNSILFEKCLLKFKITGIKKSLETNTSEYFDITIKASTLSDAKMEILDILGVPDVFGSLISWQSVVIDEVPIYEQS